MPGVVDDDVGVPLFPLEVAFVFVLLEEFPSEDEGPFATGVDAVIVDPGPDNLFVADVLLLLPSSR